MLEVKNISSELSGSELILQVLLKEIRYQFKDNATLLTLNQVYSVSIQVALKKSVM